MKLFEKLLGAAFVASVAPTVAPQIVEVILTSQKSEKARKEVQEMMAKDKEE